MPVKKVARGNGDLFHHKQRMKTYNYANIQKFTDKYGSINFYQDKEGVLAKAQKKGVLMDNTIWEEGPFVTVFEAMNKMDRVLGEWLKTQWW